MLLSLLVNFHNMNTCRIDHIKGGYSFGLLDFVLFQSEAFHSNMKIYLGIYCLIIVLVNAGK